MKVKSIAFFLCSVVATYYGGAKFYSRVNVPRTDADVQYLVDAGSYVTNDHAYVAFNAYGLPSDAPVIVGYAPGDATNESQFVPMVDLTLTEWHTQFPGSGCHVAARIEWPTSLGDRADQYQWYLYTTYTPAPSVHTNGVLNCYGMRCSIGGVPKRTVVIEDAEITYPPEELGDFTDTLTPALNATETTTERKPYELEEYFDYQW